MNIRKVLDIRVLVAAVGLFFSIFFHELFHILLHLNEFKGFSFFTNPHTIIQLDIALPQNYDIEGEEAFAYLITMSVMLLTAIIIAKISDTKDTRTVGQFLLPNSSKNEQAQAAQLVEKHL